LILFLIFAAPLNQVLAQDLIRPIPQDNSEYSSEYIETPKMITPNVKNNTGILNFPQKIKTALGKYLESISTLSFLSTKPNPENKNTTVKFIAKEENAGQPSFTFGDILANKNPAETLASQVSTTTSLIAYSDNLSPDPQTKALQIKELLAKLDQSYKESMKDFQDNRSKTLLTQNQIPNQKNLLSENLGYYPTPTPPLAENLPPTPYIPIPTLIAQVHSVLKPQTDQNNQSLSSKLTYSANYTGDINENPIQTTYTIAVLGDSMVDTLGNDLPHLKSLLRKEYPKYSFALLNYGQGSTDMESGLKRLTNTTTYLGKSYPPLLSYKPDILVVESFAYNHWGGQLSDLDHQWITIARIIDTVKEKSPNTKIILAVTIGPDTKTFGDGKLNWNLDLKWQSAIITKAYLQNMINFATSQGYPLADSYHPSIDSEGNGYGKYINQGDHLHPSDEGKLLFSQKIVETIKANQMIK